MNIGVAAYSKKRSGRAINRRQSEFWVCYYRKKAALVPADRASPWIRHPFRLLMTALYS